MAGVEKLITDHIDVWTSAIKKRNATGRGSNKKIELTGIKKLRELILELAVRGKLVPQDPNDEPASVLLEKIAEEKAQLIADNKIKKQKPLPELSLDEVDFELPSCWAVAYIPQVLAYDKYAIKRGPFGSALKKAYFVSKGIKIYEQQHAIRDDFSLGEYYITDEKFKELSAFEVKPNDLIISCSGTVGRVAVAPQTMQKGIINQALLKITLNEAALTNAYFKILFPAFYMQTSTLSDLQGTAQKNMVSVDTLKNEPFPLPPLEEQHRIVAKVDELMALCDLLEQQTEQSLSAHQTLVEVLLASLTNETLTDGDSNEEFQTSWQRIAEHFDVLFTTEASIEQLKQTILQLAVMGKLVPQNPNDEPASVLLEKIAEEKAQLIADKKIKKQKPLPAITDEEAKFDAPAGWAWCKFGLVAEFINGDRGKNYPNKSEYVDDGVPWINTGHIEPSGSLTATNMNYITKEKFDSLRGGKVQEGDLVYCLRGATFGKTAFVEPHNFGAIASSLMIIRPYTVELNSYIYKYLISPFGRTQIFRFDNGSAQPNLSANSVMIYAFPLPPLAEQHRIVAKVDELMALCEQLKARLADAQTTQLHLADAVVENALGDAL